MCIHKYMRVHELSISSEGFTFIHTYTNIHNMYIRTLAHICIQTHAGVGVYVSVCGHINAHTHRYKYTFTCMGTCASM